MALPMRPRSYRIRRQASAGGVSRACGIRRKFVALPLRFALAMDQGEAHRDPLTSAASQTRFFWAAKRRPCETGLLTPPDDSKPAPDPSPDHRAACRPGLTGALASLAAEHRARRWRAQLARRPKHSCRGLALGSCRTRRWRSKFQSPMPAAQRWRPRFQSPMPPTQRWTPLIGAWVSPYPTLDRGGRRLGNEPPDVGRRRPALG